MVGSGLGLLRTFVAKMLLDFPLSHQPPPPPRNVKPKMTFVTHYCSTPAHAGLRVSPLIVSGVGITSDSFLVVEAKGEGRLGGRRKWGGGGEG